MKPGMETFKKEQRAADQTAVVQLLRATVM